MRPVLVLCGCEMFDGDLTKALKPATGIEVFHNFTLLHDDIDRDCINCIFDHYLGQAFAWEIKITQMAVIYQKDGEYGIHKIYPLPGSHHPN